MKKLLLPVLICTIVSLCLVGCGKHSENPSSEDPKTEHPKAEHPK